MTFIAKPKSLFVPMGLCSLNITSGLFKQVTIPCVAVASLFHQALQQKMTGKVRVKKTNAEFVYVLRHFILSNNI